MHRHMHPYRYGCLWCDIWACAEVALSVFALLGFVVLVVYTTS